jgi:hypothetical protein
MQLPPGWEIDDKTALQYALESVTNEKAPALFVILIR